MKPFAPTCSVVICTRNRPAQLDECLQAAARLDYPSFDVWVIDNAPSDSQTREIAARRGVNYVLEPVVGLNRARNRGARACAGEIVAYLDDDALAEPGWLSALVSEFEDPEVMAVAGRVFPLSLETESQRLCARIGEYHSGGAEWRSVDRKTPSWFEMANFGGIGNGMNMAFRRRAFEVWPGFHGRLDRGTPLHGSGEHHAFFSLIDRGYRVVYTPRAVVRHPYPRTMETLRAGHIKNLAAASGYITLLFAEERRYRRTVVRYAVEGLKGTTRRWRGESAGPRPRIVPAWRKWLALVSGPLLYLRSRLWPLPSQR